MYVQITHCILFRYLLSGLLVSLVIDKREGVQATCQKNVPWIVSGIVTKLVSWDGVLSQILRFLGYFYY